jgi:hypothetical protein
LNFARKFDRRFRAFGARWKTIGLFGPVLISSMFHEEHPVTYFNALVQLAKVLKIEVGEAGAFDARPRPRAEALAALEEKAGPQARALFERFLKQIDQLEQAAVEGTERGERAAKAEGSEQYERAAIAEGSEQFERAAVAESSEPVERPKRRR